MFSSRENSFCKAISKLYEEKVTEELKEKYDIYNTFDVSYKENGVCNKHNSMQMKETYRKQI